MKPRHVPLTAIRAFSVAAQTGSVVRAGEELHVTPGAVSRHIGKLEDWLGQELFVREGRKLRLTPTGAMLAARADQSLSDLVSVCSEVKGESRRRQISVVSPATFGMYWLMPRIQRYQASEPDVDVWLTTRMANERVDLLASDLVVTRGPFVDQRSSAGQTVLFEEALTIIASADFMRRHEIARPRDVASVPRVAAITRPADWSQWLAFAEVGDPGAIRHRFDHQFIAVHAAREGVGAYVAPANIIGQDVLTPFPDLVLRGQPYCVHARGSEPKFLKRFLDFLVEEGRRTDERLTRADPSLTPPG